mmetsp:Transcript_119440/g.337983  ORF Transcript_119440/g.337983 Transcript_119440/m.337983 type:complete len:297 (-) Transcript_119440:1053-1943(-)
MTALLASKTLQSKGRRCCGGMVTPCEPWGASDNPAKSVRATQHLSCTSGVDKFWRMSRSSAFTVVTAAVDLSILRLAEAEMPTKAVGLASMPEPEFDPAGASSGTSNLSADWAMAPPREPLEGKAISLSMLPSDFRDLCQPGLGQTTVLPDGELRRACGVHDLTLATVGGVRESAPVPCWPLCSIAPLPSTVAAPLGHTTSSVGPPSMLSGGQCGGSAPSPTASGGEYTASPPSRAAPSRSTRPGADRSCASKLGLWFGEACSINCPAASGLAPQRDDAWPWLPKCTGLHGSSLVG